MNRFLKLSLIYPINDLSTLCAGSVIPAGRMSVTWMN
jgi:hypothetical protein